MVIKKLFEDKKSVARRSIGLFIFYIPGLLFNYGLIYLATRSLSVDSFGTFYTAISFINILFGPSFVLNMYCTRAVASVAAKKGMEAALNEYAWFLKQAFKWGTRIFSVILALMLLAGSLSGIESSLLIILVVLVSYVSYFPDLSRSAYQGLQKFVWVGSIGLTWMALRFILGGSGLYFFESVNLGFIGIIAATIVIFIFYHLRLETNSLSKQQVKYSPPVNLNKFFQFFASYALYIFILYLDILLVYFNLDKSELGTYAASSVVPKAVIVLMMPIIQIAFPLVSSQDAEGKIDSTVIAKSISLAFILSVGTVVFFMWPGSIICSGGYGLNHCDTEFMKFLILSAIPMSIMRILILIQLARHLDWHPLLIILPFLGYLAYILPSEKSVDTISTSYVIFAWLLIGIYGAFCLFISSPKKDRI